MLPSIAADIFRPGHLLNNTYRIETVLGRGGTSEVYRARSEISGRRVAIKVLKAELAKDEAYLRLLTREEAIRDVRHDAVVRYSENHRTPEGHVYLVMDYVEGPTLDKLMSKGPVPAADLMVVAERVAEGLLIAHARRVVHRDLSPDNIILRDGKPEEAVIIDFGIAKDDTPGAETIVGNEFAGKYAYAAPEQLHGRTDARSDIYALGATLLAAFRGAAPDLGANPVEMLDRKTRAPDLTGVPEPLRALLAGMTQPDPAQRFQSMEDVLRRIDPTWQPPRSAGLARTAPPARTEVPKQKTDTPRRGSGAWVVVVLLMLLAGAGGGWWAWQAGLFAPWLAEPVPTPAPDPIVAPVVETPIRIAEPTVPPTDPVPPATAPQPPVSQPVVAEPVVAEPVLPPLADPFALSIETVDGGARRVTGAFPDNAVALAALTEWARRTPGGTVSVTTARGNDLPDDWASRVVQMARAAEPLGDLRIEVAGRDVTVSGRAADIATRDAVRAALVRTGPDDRTPVPQDGRRTASGSMFVASDIPVGPAFLPASVVEEIVAAHRDCGPLSIDTPAQQGWGNGARILVSGRMASDDSRARLFEALAAAIGDRRATVDVEVLNPVLCTIEAALPKAPPRGFKVIFGFGDRPDPNPAARYFVGENPVIDVVIPSDVRDGNVWIAVVDVTGSVFHLLPNLNRPENDVATLRGGQDGDVTVRVAYSLAEAQGTPRMAFLVDDSIMGKSKIVVLHAPRQVFEVLRPMSESVQSFADALAAQDDTGPTSLFTVDSRILTTEAAR